MVCHLAPHFVRFCGRRRREGRRTRGGRRRGEHVPGRCCVLRPVVYALCVILSPSLGWRCCEADWRLLEARPRADWPLPRLLLRLATRVLICPLARPRHRVRGARGSGQLRAVSPARTASGRRGLAARHRAGGWQCLKKIEKEHASSLFSFYL